MREVLRKLANGRHSHAGLAYEVWAPVESGKGTVDVQSGPHWRAAIGRIRVPDDYPEAYARWLASLGRDGSLAMEFELTSRLLVGHGNPAPSEVGITLNHTWGVPIVPGSALKGLASHYIDAAYGPADRTIHPLDPEHPEPERAAFAAATISGREARSPGSHHQALFGAPEPVGKERFRSTGTRGGVVFHDALLVPPSGDFLPLLAPDVLTVHQKTYYNSQGSQGWPSDYDDPNPVAFLSVPPGHRFLIALGGAPEYTRVVMEALTGALEEWGVGGKTSAGYGRLRPAGRLAVDPHKTMAESSETLRALGGILGGSLTQREKLQAVRADLLASLLAASAETRLVARDMVRKAINSPKLGKDVEAFLDELS